MLISLRKQVVAEISSSLFPFVSPEMQFSQPQRQEREADKMEWRKFGCGQVRPWKEGSPVLI